jgi:hypothetical protein
MVNTKPSKEPKPKVDVKSNKQLKVDVKPIKEPKIDVKPIKEPNVVDPNVFHVQFATESKFTT